MSLLLVDFDKLFLDKSWIWLNDTYIQRTINAKSITREEQLKWFDSLPQKKDYKIWGVSNNGLPIGVCGLKIKEEKDTAEYWGYIGESEYRGAGLGTIMMQLVEEQAKNIGIKKLILGVNKDNIPAIKCYIKGGYIVNRQSDTHFYMMKSLN